MTKKLVALPDKYLLVFSRVCGDLLLSILRCEYELNSNTRNMNSMQAVGLQIPQPLRLALFVSRFKRVPVIGAGALQKVSSCSGFRRYLTDCPEAA